MGRYRLGGLLLKSWRCRGPQRGQQLMRASRIRELAEASILWGGLFRSCIGVKKTMAKRLTGTAFAQIKIPLRTKSVGQPYADGLGT